MADDTPMLDSELPTAEDVEKWEYNQLMKYLDSLSLFGSDQSRKKFQETEINGHQFLALGTSRGFWLEFDILGKLNYELAVLVSRIKGNGNEGLSSKRRYHALSPGNRLTLLQGPTRKVSTRDRASRE
jgi:hypothetical protein